MILWSPWWNSEHGQGDAGYQDTLDSAEALAKVHMHTINKMHLVRMALLCAMKVITFFLNLFFLNKKKVWI